MRIRPLVLSAALAPALAAAQLPPRAAVRARVDSIALAVIAAGRVPGLSIAVLRGRDTLVLGGWGFADLENRVPARAETVYRIGSITKQFTAALVMQLVHDGRLSLDDSLQQYVPGLPTPRGRVTIRHLLTHTSAIVNYTNLPASPHGLRNEPVHD